LKIFFEGKRPGIANAKILQRSMSEFSIGDPVRTSRCSLFSERAAIAVADVSFLIY
jgi:hypothetical protein